jgi:hypothetical protein
LSAGFEPHLSEALRQRLINADKQLMSQARQFYESIQSIADLASWRRSELAPATHWWWYLDVIAYLPARLGASPMRAAFHLIHDGEDGKAYEADDDLSANSQDS